MAPSWHIEVGEYAGHTAVNLQVYEVLTLSEAQRLIRELQAAVEA